MRLASCCASYPNKFVCVFLVQNVHLFLPASPFSSVSRDCSPVDLLLRLDDERREREIAEENGGDLAAGIGIIRALAEI